MLYLCLVVNPFVTGSLGECFTKKGANFHSLRKFIPHMMFYSVWLTLSCSLWPNNGRE